VTNLVISGLVPFTTIDMPGKNAAVIFCQGCPWRCRYCHNTHLQKPQTCSSIKWDTILIWLESRKGLLDALVFSGGEPTLQNGLKEAMHEVKAMGFEVGLHTGGYNCETLNKIMPTLDWIGLDIKSPKSIYDQITGVSNSGKSAWESLRLVLDSGIDYEIRTTYHPDLLTESNMLALAIELARANVKNWVIQTFRSKGCTDSALVANQHTSQSNAFLNRLEDLFLEYADNHTLNSISHETNSNPIRTELKCKFLIR